MIPRDHHLAWTDDDVLARLEEAGQTLLAMPANGAFPAGYRSNWPDVVHAAVLAYGYDGEGVRPSPPSAASITRMDEAFRWLQLIPLDRAPNGCGELYSRHGGAILRRIVLMRTLVSPVSGRHRWSWRKIGDAFGWDYRAVQRWHAQGLATITLALNRPGLCAAAGGCVGPGSAAVARQLARVRARQLVD